MDKVGVERRLFTSGNNKKMLDPYSPLRDGEKKEIKKILDESHKLFVADVQKARGKKLSKKSDLFSGLVWAGVDAKKLGLIDGFASADDIARDIIKEERMIRYSADENFLDRFSNQLSTYGGMILNSFFRALG